MQIWRLVALYIMHAMHCMQVFAVCFWLKQAKLLIGMQAHCQCEGLQHFIFLNCVYQSGTNILIFAQGAVIQTVQRTISFSSGSNWVTLSVTHFDAEGTSTTPIVVGVNMT